jgi:citrate lyase beta subunit
MGGGYRISSHSTSCLERLAGVVPPGRRFARTNAFSKQIAKELDLLVEFQAAAVMQPMARSSDEVATYAELLAGRARHIALIEHIDAVRSIESIAALGVVDELHIGLNDLALSMKVEDRFSLLNSSEVRRVSDCARDAGIPLGFAGIARIGDTTVPTRPELVYQAMAENGAVWTVLSRSFVDRSSDLAEDVRAARVAFAQLAGAKAHG